MNKFLLLLISSLSLFAEQFIISVPSMHCPLCTAIVRDEIKNIKGVKKVKVSLDKRNAQITADENLKLDEVLEAIKKAGYPGEIVK